MSNKDRPPASPSQTVGPFFHFGLATDERLGRLAKPGQEGERIQLRVRVVDGDGAPVPDALIEVHQAYPIGAASAFDPHPAEAVFTGFGRLPTNEEGFCMFETLRPGPISTGARAQAPHMTICLFARGLLRHLYTRVYFAGDAGHDRDAILALVPPDRRETLMATRAPDDQDTWDFVIRLQGDAETVFFDL